MPVFSISSESWKPSSSFSSYTSFTYWILTAVFCRNYLLNLSSLLCSYFGALSTTKLFWFAKLSWLSALSTLARDGAWAPPNRFLIFWLLMLILSVTSWASGDGDLLERCWVLMPTSGESGAASSLASMSVPLPGSIERSRSCWLWPSAPLFLAAGRTH